MDDDFRLNVLGRTPFGRSRVRLESEVKSNSPFDGQNTEVGAQAHDTGTAGAELSELVTNTVGTAACHWRVRLLYDAVTTPYAVRSRWFTMPWKGWQEAMLRTAPPGPAAGRLATSPGGPLRLRTASGNMIRLDWDASCLETDTTYALYEGLIGDFASHDSRFCTLNGQTVTFPPLAGDTYYLVVPRNATREGSYGTNSDGVERPQGIHACLVQRIEECP